MKFLGGYCYRNDVTWALLVLEKREWEGIRKHDEGLRLEREKVVSSR